MIRRKKIAKIVVNSRFRVFSGRFLAGVCSDVSRSMTRIMEAEATDEKQRRCGSTRQLRCIDNWFSSIFHDVGTAVYRHRRKVLLFSICFNLVLLSGLFFFEVDDNLEYLFTPLGTPGLADKASLESKYLIGDEGVEFIPDRILSSYLKHGETIMLPKTGSNILEPEIMAEVLDIHEKLMTFSFEVGINGNATNLTYNDICMTWLERCVGNEVLALIGQQMRGGNDVIQLTYPSTSLPTGQEIFIAQELLGIDVEGGKDAFFENKNSPSRPRLPVLSAEGVYTYYFMSTGSPEMESVALAWEHTAETLLLDIKATTKYVDVYFAFSYSLTKEINVASQRVIPRFAATFAMLALFAILSLVTTDWVVSRPILGIMGVVSAGFAITSAIGLLAFCHVPFNEIVAMMPFLVIGVGVDDMFIMVAAWRQISLYVPVEERMGRTYSEAAVSITITNLTDIIAFLVGSTTPIPAVRIFCIYAGVAMFFAYVYQITFFGACMALTGEREEQNRHCLTFKVVKPKNEAPNSVYRIFCAGGVPRDPKNRLRHRHAYFKHPLATFFRDYYGPFVGKWPTKIMAMVLLTVLTIGSVYGCLNIKEGLRLHNLAPDHSSPWLFYSVRDRFLTSFSAPVSVVFNEELEYWDANVQSQIEDATQHLEESFFSYGRFYTTSWIRTYIWYLSTTGRLDQGTLSKEDFLRILNEEFLKDYRFKHFTLDIVFTNVSVGEVAAIETSRLVMPTQGAQNAVGEKDFMLDLRTRASEVELNITVFTPFFLVFDSYVGIISYTLQTVSIALVSMFVVAIVMIPHPLCAVSVTLCAISIDAAVLGYMSLWGVTLDIVSVVNILLCIGFSVDFSAHITYAYVSSSKENPTQRAVEALRNLGTPISLSALSSVIAIAPLSTASVYIFRTFFKTLFLVMVVGALHGLLFLPVTLSLLGRFIPASKRKDLASTGSMISHGNSIKAFVDMKEQEVLESLVTSL